MPRFVVDSASLDRIRDRLGLLHGDLLAAPDIVGSYTDAMLGGRVLEAELDGFAREWHHAVGTVAGEIDLMQMRLTQAAAAYRQIEDHTRERARQAKHGSRGSGRGSGVTIIEGGGSDGGVGVGSGTTVIGGAGGSGGAGGATHHHSGHPGSGSGTTVIGGGSGSGSGSGSGTTVIGGGSGSGSGTTVIGGGPSSGSGTTVVDTGGAGR